MIGAIAQLVERVLCKHEVVGSNPSGSTISPKGLALRIEMRAVHLRDRGKQVNPAWVRLFGGLLVVVHLTS